MFFQLAILSRSARLGRFLRHLHLTYFSEKEVTFLVAGFFQLIRVFKMFQKSLIGWKIAAAKQTLLFFTCKSNISVVTVTLLRNASSFESLLQSKEGGAL